MREPPETSRSEPGREPKGFGWLLRRIFMLLGLAFLVFGLAMCGMAMYQYG